MIHKIDHIVITTADISSCIAFYQALGFRAKDGGGHWELFSGDFKINVHLKGRELKPKAETVQTGSADFCMETDCPMELCRDTVIKNGLSIELGIVTRSGAKGEMRSIYLRDPDGNLVELCSYE